MRRDLRQVSLQRGAGECLRALGWAMGAEGPPPGRVPAAHLLHRRSGS